MRVVAVGGGHGTAVSLGALRRVSTDVILIGPGSFFTSVLAACVVPGVTQALAGTAAKKIYVANLHDQIPETEDYVLEVHVDALLRHGVVPNVVPVDQCSEFASQQCSLPVHIANRSGRNGMVHDVQKLTEAVFDEVR